MALNPQLTKLRPIIKTQQRTRRMSQASCEGPGAKKGLLIGAYSSNKLTSAATKYDEEVGGKLRQLLKGVSIPLGSARVYNNLGPEHYAVAITGIGPEGIGFNEAENINECKENVRVAAAVGTRALQDAGCTTVHVEGFTNAEAAAEGASLAAFKFQDYRNKLNWSTMTKVELFDDPDRDGWEKGTLKADAQNVARRLSDIPANLMTPSAFAQAAIDILCPCGVHVEVRNKDWIESKKLTAFLSIAKGSCEAPLFLELSYCGGSQDDKPVAMVGKGVTFDSGGICLKECKGMHEHRADMAGGAVVVGTLKAIATLAGPINVNACIPLCENMPSGQSIKPGDVIIGLADKSIHVQDTSKDGRVIIADAISYTTLYKPCICMSIATTSRSMRDCMGSSATGTFSTSEVVWKELEKAGIETGDRVWRFPFWKHFCKKNRYHAADINNVGTGRGGDPCNAAAFILEFAPPVDMVHMDIAGSGMLCSAGYPYLREGTMSGRPVRTLAQFLMQMACPRDKGSVC